MFIPIGKEAGFKGVVDLVKMKGYIFADDGSGNFSESEIPADCKDSATEFRQKLIEDIAETNEQLVEKYLEGQELSSEELAGGIKTGIINQSLIPVICGSGIHNTGVKMIMDTVADYLPSPLERAAIEVVEPKTKEQKTIEPKNDAPLASS